jgi:hypothetical protein
MMMAQTYLARYQTPFAAYMALQRALLFHFLMRGGTPEQWSRGLAPAFSKRYGSAFGLRN